MSTKKQLLVVDNEIDVCNFVKLFFELRGFQVTTAFNGDEALSKMDGNCPNVVLLDIRMRWETEGLEYLPRIKESYPKAQVILVSGIGDQDIIEQAKTMGAQFYVIKPLILDQLENLVMTNIIQTGFAVA